MHRSATAGALLLTIAFASACGGKSTGSSASNAGIDAGCSEDRCLEILAAEQEQPVAIAVNADGVFWATLGSSPGDGSVMTVPLTGGTPRAIAASLPAPYGIALDGANVYWTATDDLEDGGVEGTVTKAPLGGGASTTLASGPGGYLGIAVNATTAVWANDFGPVMSVALSGGDPVVLATSQLAYAVAADDSNAYWVTYATPGGTVIKAPIAGGPLVTLASDQNRAGPIAVQGATVYWQTADATVTSVPTAGGSTTLVVAGPAPSQQNRPFSIAVDATSVYWTDQAGGTVSKAALGGGAVTTLAVGQNAPGAIAVDGASVYWANQGTGVTDGSVMKLTPK